jgi:hypothetical protein
MGRRGDYDKQRGDIMKKLLTVLLCLGLVGCAHSVLRSEFKGFTSMNYPPKGGQEEVLLMTEKPQRPYQEIGLITLEAKRSYTSRDKIDKEILTIAKAVGADAVIKLQYNVGEIIASEAANHGVVMRTKDLAQGVAIVFTDKK